MKQVLRKPIVRGQGTMLQELPRRITGMTSRVCWEINVAGTSKESMLQELPRREIGCLDKTLNAGVIPSGGTMKSVNIGTSGKVRGTPKKICLSCNDVLDHFGVNK